MTTRHSGRTTSLRHSRSILSLCLAATLLTVGTAAPTLAAKAKSKAKAKPDPTPTVEVISATSTTVESVRGKSKSQKVAKARVANRLTRFNDPTGDLVTRDGSAIDVDEPWADLTAVSVVRSGAAVKMLRVLREDYPRGTAGVYYGVDADWRPKDEAFHIVARTGGKLPNDAASKVQLIVTFDGDAAVPVRAGGLLGPYDGARSFSLNGPFEGGNWASGTTDLGDWDLDQELPFYNGPSEDMGYYDSRNASFVHIARVPKGATSATVTLRSVTEAGEVFDRVELPAGGRFLGLASPTWGLKVRDGGVPLACRSLVTLSAGSAGAETVEPGMDLVRYSVGWNDEAGVTKPLEELGDGMQLELLEIGTEDEPEPELVDATVSVDSDAQMATFELVVPDGQWMLSVPEDEAIETSGGQLLFDLRPLTGSAGFLAGPGLDGLVAGVPECGVRSASDTGTDAS